MIIIGLTGSIGMGKSTAANIFKELGVAVHDADAAVHKLLDFNGAAVLPLLELFPNTKLEDKDGNVAIDRKALGAIVFNNPEKLKMLENVLHPIVRSETDDFLKEQFNKGAQIVVLDIPLLFETHGETRCDAVLVVTASYETQKKRVLERPNMSEERFKQILEKQVPDAEKRRRADFVIEMEHGIEQAKKDIEAVLKQVKKRSPKAINRLIP